MADRGTIRQWDDGEGWGVIDSSATPGGCWAHFSHAAVPGEAVFVTGQSVLLEWEARVQDGYPYRAVRFWPSGSQPFDRATRPGSGGAYHSTLTLNFDYPEKT